MATHVIMAEDWRAGGEPRSITWDDETGEIGGEHVEVPRLRGMVATAERVGHLLDEKGRLDLRDPRHDPADFLAVLEEAFGGGSFRYREEVRLPQALRGVEPTPWVMAVFRGEVF